MNKACIDDLVEGKFYFKVVCTRCENSAYKCYCPFCQQAIYSVDHKTFSEGTLITCVNVHCRKTFQLITCPSCTTVQFFSDERYSMGSPLDCRNCKFTFRLVTCPDCGEPNYEDSYYPSQTIQCRACHKKFQQISCPSCILPKYFNEGTYIYGSTQQCKSCSLVFEQMVCGSCRCENFYTGSELRKGLQIKCKNMYCQKTVEVVACPKCKCQNVFPETTGNKEILPFRECRGCKAIFFAYACSTCHDIQYFGEDNISQKSKSKCANCKADIPSFSQCRRCSSVHIAQEKCPGCGFKDDINQEDRICTICQVKPSNIALIPCGHVKTCMDCTAQLTRKICPVCRVPYKDILKIFL
jgi:Uncharacterized conserved protein, contains RING Zn-finger